MLGQTACRVSEVTEVGAVRRLAIQMAQDSGLNETDCGRVALSTTELAGNLLRHARDGEILLQPVRNSGVMGIELLSVDRGPGMANPEQCLRDGFSTGVTLGTGLGAVRRLSSEFDLYSIPEIGTVVLSRVHCSTDATAVPDQNPCLTLRLGAVCQPLAGEIVCGDTWHLVEREGDAALILADGLGHGVLAAEASRSAVDAFRNHAFGPLTLYMQHANEQLRITRGAAVAAVRLSRHSDGLTYAGLGNISGTIFSPDGTSRGLMSYNGTVGIDARRVRELQYEFRRDDLLVMHSDGLRSRWSMAERPGLLSRHPAVIAGVLYRDFRRAGDDVTVVVLQRRW
ncbi:MAG: ATP-binding SpoIIE family protein phosphatase [Gemmatimonadaceae bacterium]